VIGLLTAARRSSALLQEAPDVHPALRSAMRRFIRAAVNGRTHINCPGFCGGRGGGVVAGGIVTGGIVTGNPCTGIFGAPLASTVIDMYSSEIRMHSIDQ
jgi:hypothetical protein